MSCNANGFDLIVVGSGPAGLAAAVAAECSGKRVLILEQLASPGRKLLASGGGRCNVSNILKPGEMAASFDDACRFVRHALYTFPNAALCKFFAERGVELELTDGFHWFPRSRRAQDILNALLSAAPGAQMISGLRADKLLIESGKVCGVRAGERDFYAPEVVIACGGKSYPALGGTGGGYKLAADAGHRIVKPLPAMVGVQCRENWVRECAGISLPDAETRIALPGEKFRCRGELLFTHTGISAFAVLDISGRISELLETMDEVPLELNLCPGRRVEDWLELFAAWQQNGGSKSVVNLLSQEMPKRLAAMLVPDGNMTVSGFSKVHRRELAARLTALKLHITATDGWEKAMVTRGGVALDEVDPKTLESRLVPGLFFAGEVLDVDGPCGGYNISWALASGFLTGNMILRNA